MTRHRMRMRVRVRCRALAACVSLGLAWVLAGCASQPAKSPPTASPPPATAPEPPVAAPPSPTPGGTSNRGVPQASGPIAAPWDTAARSMETRRQHVYPQGESEISRRLLASIPDPSVAGRLSGSVPPPTPPPAPKPAAPTDPSTCWEVQILMTRERDRAERVRDEAQRKLDVAVWVRTSDGMHRVRLGGCLTTDGAADLAARVRQNGYPEAFRVRRDP